MIEPSIRLRRAIYLKDAAIVKRLITADPKLIKNPDFDDRSNTSLHLAAKAGLYEIVEVLLQAGHEEPEISRNADWETPLMLACQSGHVEIGELLIERCARCIPLPNRRGLDALAMCCMQPISTPLIPTLLAHPEFPASVNSRDKDGNTPLHHASAAGSLKALRILLNSGADPHAKNSYDWTPLAYSQTVAAEVYFKNLVADYDRRRAEGQDRVREDEDAGRNRKAGGVRLITDEGRPPERPGTSAGGGSSGSGGPAVDAWSPVMERRRAMTPTVGRSGGWEFEAARARASSGD